MFSRICSTTRCSRTPTVSSLVRRYVNNPHGNNRAIVEMLVKCRDEEKSREDKNGYKIRTFDNAIDLISNLDRPIRSAGEAMTMKGVGIGIARRISEFMVANGLPEGVSDESGEVQRDSLKLIAKSELERISGIGRTKAAELVEAGCMRPADLRKEKYHSMLTHSQKIGFKYMQHFKKSVTLEEAETVAEFIRNNISSQYEVTITGSHRRGAATSSDIQLIILHPSHVHVPVPEIPPPHLMDRPRVIRKSLRLSYVTAAAKSSSLLHSSVVPTLEDRGLVAAQVSSGSRRWQGVVRIPQKDDQGHWYGRSERLRGIKESLGEFRRLDMNLVPLKSRGSALIAFTGDKTLNKDLRLRAISMGLHLDEFGLWRWVSNSPTHARDTESRDMSEALEPDQEDHEADAHNGFWQLIRAKTEYDIFEQLGLNYIDPWRRNFAFLQDSAATSRRHKGSHP